jgi:hypothetical protein
MRSSQLRKTTKTKGAFVSDQALLTVTGVPYGRMHEDAQGCIMNGL